MAAALAGKEKQTDYKDKGTNGANNYKIIIIITVFIGNWTKNQQNNNFKQK